MKEKGFTLIELLAVIVILAIIALIATPLILGVIDDARRDAFKNTAYNIISSAEIKAAKDINVIKDGLTIEISNKVISPMIDFKGTVPTNGRIYVGTDGSTKIVVEEGNLCAYKHDSSSKPGEVLVIKKGDSDYDRLCDFDLVAPIKEETFSTLKNDGKNCYIPEPNYDICFFTPEIIKKDVISLKFLKGSGPSGGIDVSEEQDGSIKLHYKSVGEKTAVEIYSESTILAPANSSGLLEDFLNIEEISFSNFNTKNVEAFVNAFYRLGYTSTVFKKFDISGFDLSSIKVSGLDFAFYMVTADVLVKDQEMYDLVMNMGGAAEYMELLE